ncbi:DedA family protein [Sporosalibacterium faouarense]|uniref:DedA family protein n=1 Tax=Sporosalibacterium faouarense TaxID=516123 RepID=UPI00141C53A4|nr:DedA family protein [Sporosalibacterium faouarense]MTI49081.1 DedA family protein [Bacillota bacterium]
MEELIINFTKNIVSENVFLSYVFFFLSQTLQVLFPPYPGDMVLIIEGYLTELANLNLILVIVTAVTATSLSSMLLYNIGRKKEERILHSKVIKILFDTNKVEKLRNLFHKFGPAVIIGSKFIPGIYSITALSAGIFKVDKKKAYTSIVAISSFHHIILIVLGKILRENWTIIFYKIEKYNRYLFVVLIGAFAVYALMHILKRKLLS